MLGIVLVGHGGLAREYVAAIEHVLGPTTGIKAISIEADHDRQAKQDEICEAILDVDDGHGVVIATDIFGGSPSNLCVNACVNSGTRILSGMNLPMLIKLAKSRHKTPDEAVAIALSAGKKYMNAHFTALETFSA